MDFRELYTKFEDDFERIEDTEVAEDFVSELLKQVKDVNTDLFFDLDEAIGALARAYEKQGFKGGLATARSVMAA